MNTAGSAQIVLLTVIMTIYAFLGVLVLIRAVSGPRIADRLMAVNMIGTIGITLMAMTAVKLNEDYLLDVCIIYAMISFISVAILTKVYMGVHKENELRMQHERITEFLTGPKASEKEEEEDEWDKLLNSIEDK